MKSILSSFFVIIMLATACSSNVDTMTKRDANLSNDPNLTTNPIPASSKGLPRVPYPEKAYADKMQGTTGLNLFVNKQGIVEQAIITESSGFPILDKAASKWAIKRWNFIPCNRNKESVDCWYPIKYHWKIGY